MLDRPPRQPKNLVIVEGRGGPGAGGGCLTIFLALVLVGASIKFWYVSVPLLVLLGAGIVYQSRKTGVPVGRRISAAVTAARRQRTGVGSSPIVTGSPENVVIVKKQRGCTCCGTGCVLMAAGIPLSVFAMWDILGVVIAVAFWPALFLAAHVVRFVTGTQKRYCDTPATYLRPAEARPVNDGSLV